MSIKELLLTGGISFLIVITLVLILNIKAKKPIWEIALIIFGGTFGLFIPLSFFRFLYVHGM